MDRTMKHKGWYWAIAALILFQSSDVSLRLASVQTQFAVGTVLQATPLMLVALAAAVRHRIKFRAGLPGRAWSINAAYGLLQFCIGNLLFYAAVQQGGLSIASPAVQSQAIWAVVLGGLFLRERISRMMIGGITLFVAGLILLSWFKSSGASVSGTHLWGLITGILGGLAWAGASAVQSSQLRQKVPLSYILAAGSAAGVMCLHVFILFCYGPSVWATVGADGALKVLAAGCFNGLAVWCISQALRFVEISKIIPVISLSIVLNTLIGGFWFGEYVNFGSIAGMLIVFCGVILVQEPKPRGEFKQI
ncbi:hypothetical protein SD70_25320 [Gordoniibacillus kamchatkensis]|uniref:EamA domain-containing protein n=1 Tax=Gordoniibacillus kamchatkensis TaxID=1590651 RepID=A0ABR5AC60_9BACL|nr:DMT family transporter [Paenibacillus sp. VKM B-2647]KIL38614.1 hypothetical protein SD70_25320 [Paenibacillus sp. VKM B-2647]